MFPVSIFEMLAKSVSNDVRHSYLVLFFFEISCPIILYREKTTKQQLVLLSLSKPRRAMCPLISWMRGFSHFLLKTRELVRVA
jgi:hypothetical protein